MNGEPIIDQKGTSSLGKASNGGYRDVRALSSCRGTLDPKIHDAFMAVLISSPHNPSRITHTPQSATRLYSRDDMLSGW